MSNDWAVVAGASGTIGSAISTMLSDRGLRVLGLGRNADPARGIRSVDLADAEAVAETGFDLDGDVRVVVHAAGPEFGSGIRDVDQLSAHVERPDGTSDQATARSVVFATNGYGARRVFIGRLIPEIENALYHCGPGSTGDALVTGEKFSAARRFATGSAPDSFGHVTWHQELRPPYAAVKVTGALFHTQGGSRVDEHARIRNAGMPIPGVSAVGGAAVGTSEHGASGCLAGNGLLPALGLGHIAGKHAAVRQ